MHIDVVNLADGDYELIPSDPLVASDVDLNCANVNQDLGQAPEDSQFDMPKKASPGA